MAGRPGRAGDPAWDSVLGDKAWWALGHGAGVEHTESGCGRRGPWLDEPGHPGVAEFGAKALVRKFLEGLE